MGDAAVRLLPGCAVLFDGMSWPSEHSACEASWKARYQPQHLTQTEHIKLATVANAYVALLGKTQRERSRVARVISVACASERCDWCTVYSGYAPAPKRVQP